MKPSLFILSLLIVFWNSQLCAKVRYDMPDVPDMSPMSEYDKASYWLDDRGQVDLWIYPSNSPLELSPLKDIISINSCREWQS